MRQEMAVENFTVQEARQFVSENRYSLGSGPVLSRCIDGRNTHDQSQEAARAVPGADAGYVLGVLAAVRSFREQGRGIPDDMAEALIDTTIEIIGADNFRWHSAEGHDFDGCGHLGKAKESPEAYGVTASDIDFLERRLQQLEKAHNAGKVILQGSHKEQAVIIVDSAEFGLHSQDAASQSFIYHRTLDGQFQQKLAEELQYFPAFTSLGIDNVELEKVLSEVLSAQLAETAKRLAKGRPQFAVSIGSDATDIQELGLVAP